MEKERNDFKNTNLKMGEKLSKIASFYSKKTHFNNNSLKINNIDNGFSNFFEINDLKLGISSDGIGSKVEIAERMKDFSSLGFDLMAMLVDDLVCNGFNPFLVSNVLDMNKLNENIIKQLFEGFSKAADFCSVAISGGEIAELENRVSGYGNYNLNWSGTALGLLFDNFKIPLNKNMVKKDDSIFIIKSEGFRSNGFTLARSILNNIYGENWHNKKFENKTWGEILLKPSLIYTPFIRKLFAENKSIKAIGHITGGGIYENLKRIIPDELNHSKLSLFDIPKEMRKLIKISNIDENLAYKTWNMGQGMLIISSDNIDSFSYNNKDYIVKKAGMIF